MCIRDRLDLVRLESALVRGIERTVDALPVLGTELLRGERLPVGWCQLLDHLAPRFFAGASSTALAASTAACEKPSGRSGDSRRIVHRGSGAWSTIATRAVRTGRCVVS